MLRLRPVRGPSARLHAILAWIPGLKPGENIEDVVLTPRFVTTKRLIQKGFNDAGPQIRTDYPRSSWQVYIRDAVEIRMSGA